MNTSELAMLHTLDGEPMPLTAVQARGTLAGVLFELEVEQHYRNPHASNIEAVYTFPLAPGAVLLGVTFEINGKSLTGQAVPRQEAEAQYEAAIESGDSALLLEQSGDGLYTVNLGNLMAGEAAVVRFRYAELLPWAQGQLRLTVPTTIAPRYGEAEAAGLLPHQVPETDLGVSYPFQLELALPGDLDPEAVQCPTHPVALRRTESGLSLSLSGALDRDFVLTVAGQGDSVVHVAEDGDALVALASFCPRLPERLKDGPLSLRLVLDCSGSMAGDSIAAARRGALKVLESLKDEDSFAITRFGSAFSHYREALVPADVAQRLRASQWLAGLEADMGGTEMARALAAAAGLEGGQAGGCVLLITDGEIWDVDGLIESARPGGLRYFVVGVGASPSHATLRRLAEATAGSYEAVTPGEDIEAAVVRQFRRMRLPRAQGLELLWPDLPVWSTALPKVAFRGDTLRVFAGLEARPTQPVGLVYLLEDGTCVRDWVEARPWPGQPDTLARLSAAMRLREAAQESHTSRNEQALADLAVRYNLVSAYTHYVVVDVRAASEKADDLPQLARVRQMLAAGWGGYGQADAPAVLRSRRVQAPAGMNSIASPCVKAEPILITAPEFIEALDRRISSRLRGRVPTRISVLEKLGLDPEICRGLTQWVAEGGNESEVVLAFLAALDSAGWLITFGPRSRSRLDTALADRPVPPAWLARALDLLGGSAFEQQMQASCAPGLGALEIPAFLRRTEA